MSKQKMSFNSYVNCFLVAGTTTLSEAKFSPLPFGNYAYSSNLQLNHPWEQTDLSDFQYDCSRYFNAVVVKFASGLIENMKNIDPKYGKLINENFWDLF